LNNSRISIAASGVAFLLFFAGCDSQSLLHDAAPTVLASVSHVPLTPGLMPTPCLTETPFPTQISTQSSSIGAKMVSEIDGMVLVYVPAGEFEMGSEDGDSDAKPVHAVYVDAFYLYQTEVTNAMYAEFLNQTGNQSEGGVTWLDASDSDVQIHQSGGTWLADDGYSNHPAIEVSWYGAQAYCEWAGGGVPTEAEWEKAARGGLVGMVYPWGDQDPVCDIGAENGAQFGSCGGQTAPVGSFAPNGYGLYDMAGNVWEWISSCYWDYPYENGDGREDLKSDCNRVLRGGSWSLHPNLLRVFDRYFHGPLTDTNYLNGFRCAISLP
jgi:formylglycine-generating enzyme required for sulfatase activity